MSALQTTAFDKTTKEIAVRKSDLLKKATTMLLWGSTMSQEEKLHVRLTEKGHYADRIIDEIPVRTEIWKKHSMETEWSMESVYKT